MEDTKVLTGGKRIVKEIRRPSKSLPIKQETKVTREPTPEGPPSKSGNVPPQAGR